MHNILQQEWITELPLKGNGPNASRILPTIVAHLYMHLEILLLQVTKQLFVSRHMERRTTIKIPHRSHAA